MSSKLVIILVLLIVSLPRFSFCEDHYQNVDASRGRSAESKEEIKNSITSLWSKLRFSIATGDIDTALDCIEESQRAAVRQSLDLLKDHLKEMASGLSTLEKCDIPDNAKRVVCEFVRKEGDQVQSFEAQFVRDRQGNWKIYYF